MVFVPDTDQWGKKGWKGSTTPILHTDFEAGVDTSLSEVNLLVIPPNGSYRLLPAVAAIIFLHQARG